MRVNPSRRCFSERQIAVIILQIRKAATEITGQLEIVILPGLGIAPGAANLR